MSVEPAAPARTTVVSLAVRAAPALVAAASSALLATGAAGLMPALFAVCAAAALAALGYAGLLLSAARGACPGTGFVILAVLAVGVTTAAATIAPQSSTLAAALASGGLAVVAVLYIAAMLRSPGATPAPLARVRQLLDGLGIGTSFMFVCWLLVVAPTGHRSTLAALDATAVSLVVATAVVAPIRAGRYRSAAWASAGGTSLSMIGLAGLAAALGGAIPPLWLPLVGGCLAYGPVLSWLAARVYATAPPAGAAGTVDDSVTSYPLMAAPIAAVLVAAGYAITTARGFDTTSAGLGCAVVAVTIARETVAVFDLRRYTRTVAAREAHLWSLVSGSANPTIVLDGDPLAGLTGARTQPRDTAGTRGRRGDQSPRPGRRCARTPWRRLW
jgi:hypothetical protein